MKNLATLFLMMTMVTEAFGQTYQPISTGLGVNPMGTVQCVTGTVVGYKPQTLNYFIDITNRGSKGTQLIKIGVRYVDTVESFANPRLNVQWKNVPEASLNQMLCEKHISKVENVFEEFFYYTVQSEKPLNESRLEFVVTEFGFGQFSDQFLKLSGTHTGRVIESGSGRIGKLELFTSLPMSSSQSEIRKIAETIQANMDGLKGEFSKQVVYSETESLK